MESGFWHERWREGRIGFHQDRVTPLLEQYWDAVAAPAGCRVLVPLCGKSLDLDWLAARGHSVLGVELSPLAISQYFGERGVVPEVHESPAGLHHVAGAIEIIQGDAFELPGDLLADCAAVHDRAALIALPHDLRRHYLATVYARLPAGCRGLLVTLEYPPEQKVGPPFPVDAREVSALFHDRWDTTLLERRDILSREPGWMAEGITDLHTGAWRLQKR